MVGRDVRFVAALLAFDGAALALQCFGVLSAVPPAVVTLALGGGGPAEVPATLDCQRGH